MTSESVLAPIPIENQILMVRGQKVLLDADLAALYGVEVRALNQAVKRNGQRFPADFVFQLAPKEHAELRSQTVMSKSGRGGRRYAPYAFTEHGAIMAATVLNSPRAVEMSIYVVRVFVHQRETLASHKALAAKLAELEKRLETHDSKIDDIIKAILCSRCHRRSPSGRSAFAPKRPPNRRCCGPVRAGAKSTLNSETIIAK
jgi:hypothetical protein